MRSAVFLDRDDTLIAASKSGVKLLDGGVPRLLPGVSKGLRLLSDAGFLLVIVTNQPSIPLGRHTIEQYNEINRKISEQLTTDGVGRDLHYYCCAHPFSEPCACRKPNPGLFHTAAIDLGIDLTSSYMVGDEVSDAQAALAAGLRNSVIVWPKFDMALVEGSMRVLDFLLAAKTIEYIRRFGNDKVPRDHKTLGR